MLESGLKESACVSSKRLSPCLTRLSVGSDEEDYLEVCYTDTMPSDRDAIDTNNSNTKPANRDAESNTTSIVNPLNCDIGNNDSNKCNEDTHTLATAVSVAPPSGDGVGNGKVDHVITHQVQRSRNLSGPIDAVRGVGKTVDRRTMSEGGIPGFGTATPQMEELLEHDDVFSWDGADVLHLEIVDDEPSESTDDGGDKPKDSHPEMSDPNNSSLPCSKDAPLASDIPGVHSPKRLCSVPESKAVLSPWPSARNDDDGVSDPRSSPSLMVTGQAATICSKLSLAVHDRNHGDNVVEGSDLSPPSPVSFDTDGQGFPLAIFSKVSCFKGLLGFINVLFRRLVFCMVFGPKSCFWLCDVLGLTAVSSWVGIMFQIILAVYLMTLAGS